MRTMIFCSILLLTLLQSFSHAEELSLYLMDVRPLTMDEPERKGIVGDITLEAIRRSGLKVKLIVEPSNRAMDSVKHNENVLIIPLARVKDRELDYTWIAPIVKVNRAFFTLDTPANSFAEGRSRYKTIAVSRGSAGVSILLDNGFTREQIVEVTQGETAPKMLLLNRIDAWYNLISESRLLLKTTDIEKKVKMGDSIGATFNYLACSKICNPQLVSRLRAAVESMEKDGSAKAIKASYGMTD